MCKYDIRAREGRPSCRTVILFLLILCGGGFWSAAYAGEPECTVLTVEGKMEVARKDTSAWSPGRTNMVLQVGDRLRTGLRSRATLQWSDLSVVRVDELTTMEIQPPPKENGKPEMDLKSGAAYFFSREKPSEIQFRTPVASGAIRGTEFNLAVAGDGRTTLSLLDGAVDMADAQGSTTLNSGEQGTVEPGQAPKKTAVIDAASIIQWTLYYPAVVDPDELGLTNGGPDALADSLKAYREGDLLDALNSYPENRQSASEPEQIYHAALLLAVGQVDQTEDAVKSLPNSAPTVNALQEVIQVVKNEKPGTLSAPITGSEWLARSYLFQSESKLPEALQAAREATAKSPNFGATWVRMAELEFGFGKTSDALEALNKGLALSPRNAQGLALKGFMLAAADRNTEAAEFFDRAIAADGALANGWLGRGMMKIRAGHVAEGRKDLQVAATLEPNRSLLRSYLGKAFAENWDMKHANKELRLAKQIDPNDPTPWLYSALLDQQDNQDNEAISDLEKSKELNDNRSVFRSRLLLDQDQAVRGANLAAMYQDAGMVDVSVQEAARAVDDDYANFSAHKFLSDSYDALLDPKEINLRYETAWYSELLLADLLTPVNGANLSQNISQEEYSRLFEGNHIGVFSDTEYSSHGDVIQNGSQYGVIDNTAYALDESYQSQRGYRPNNDLQELDVDARFKQQITAKDSLFLQLGYYDATSGDLSQYYNQDSASQTERVKETQTPNLLVGWHHEWSPGSHTLALFTRFEDKLEINDSNPSLLWLQTAINPFTGGTNVSLSNPSFLSLNYQSELVAYSGELQQIWETPLQTLVAGGRYQIGWADTQNLLDRQTPLDPIAVPVVDQSFTPELTRASVYGYEDFKPLDNLSLIAGASYDNLHYPVNVDIAPISDGEQSKQEISPKAGIMWSPFENTHLRADFTRSLGGVFFDNSIRLEPAEIAGFNQAFRSLIPESVAGLIPGTRFETFGLGLDQSFKTGTYLTVQAQLLRSKGDRTVGVLTNSDEFIPMADSASSADQSLNYEEKSLAVSLNQLIGRDVAVGVRYQLTYGNLNQRFTDISSTTPGVSGLDGDFSATLNQVLFYAGFEHPSGFFSEVDVLWSEQSNSGYSAADPEPGDAFWQLDLYAGYRFWLRHGEAKIGLVDLTDQDYRLNPLTLYNELPRQRAVTFSLKFYF